MLKDSWNIQMLSPRFANTSFIFMLKGREDVYISIESDEESEAWEKLGVLLGKEDKENVKTEVFEGRVNRDCMDGFEFGNVVSPNGEEFDRTLIKHDGRQVKITVEFLT